MKLTPTSHFGQKAPTGQDVMIFFVQKGFAASPYALAHCWQLMVTYLFSWRLTHLHSDYPEAHVSDAQCWERGRSFGEQGGAVVLMRVMRSLLQGYTWESGKRDAAIGLAGTWTRIHSNRNSKAKRVVLDIGSGRPRSQGLFWTPGCLRGNLSSSVAWRSPSCSTVMCSALCSVSSRLCV